MQSGLDNICIMAGYMEEEKIQIEIFVWEDNCVESKCIRAICDVKIRISKLVFCCTYDFRQYS